MGKMCNNNTQVSNVIQIINHKGLQQSPFGQGRIFFFFKGHVLCFFQDVDTEAPSFLGYLAFSGRQASASFLLCQHRWTCIQCPGTTQQYELFILTDTLHSTTLSLLFVSKTITGMSSVCQALWNWVLGSHPPSLVGLCLIKLEAKQPFILPFIFPYAQDDYYSASLSASRVLLRIFCFLKILSIMHSCKDDDQCDLPKVTYSLINTTHSECFPTKRRYQSLQEQLCGPQEEQRLHGWHSFWAIRYLPLATILLRLLWLHDRIEHGIGMQS